RLDAAGVRLPRGPLRRQHRTAAWRVGRKLARGGRWGAKGRCMKGLGAEGMGKRRGKRGRGSQRQGVFADRVLFGVPEDLKPGKDNASGSSGNPARIEGVEALAARPVRSAQQQVESLPRVILVLVQGQSVQTMADIGNVSPPAGPAVAAVVCLLRRGASE